MKCLLLVSIIRAIRLTTGCVTFSTLTAAKEEKYALFMKHLRSECSRMKSW